MHKTIHTRPKALGMVVIMVLMSLGPLFTVPVVSAHAEPSGVSWPLEGSNDTGWVRLDALGADNSLGQQATADWDLMFAPGAVLSNVSLEVRTDPQNGLSITEPLLTVDGLNTPLFDWRGLGTFGVADGFANGPTYSGRLTPNSNSNAGWDLPSDAVISDMIIETLAPADPVMSLTPIDFNIRSSIADPIAGHLYISVDDELMVLNANNNPVVVDVRDFSGHGGVADMAVDSSNNILHLLLGDGTFQALDLDNGMLSSGLGASSLDRFIRTNAGAVFGADGQGIHQWDGTKWSLVAAAPATDGLPEALSMIETNGVVYASLNGLGVLRYNTNTQQALGSWSTANNLHSDSVTHMAVSGNQLLLGSPNNGVGRYDASAGFWLSTWTSANWLNSDNIHGLKRVGTTLFIFNGDSLHSYNVTNGVFSTTYSLASLGLTDDEPSGSLIHWPAQGTSAPSNDALLVSDGSGRLAHLAPSETPILQPEWLLASGPTSSDMSALVELDGILYIGMNGATGIDRYDIDATVWMTPLSTTSTVELLRTDGTDLFAGTSAGEVMHLSANGTVVQTWTGTGCWPAGATLASMDIDAQDLVITTENGEFAAIDRTTNACTPYDTTNGLPTQFLGDVALYGGVAYIATENRGVLRYDIGNDAWLEPWGSTGVNGVTDAPIALAGNVLYLGLPGYGVARKDMNTGEILAPLTSSGRNPVLPSNVVYALEADGSDVFIGTQQGARKWDGNQASSFGLGSTWQTRPSQFFDFEADGNDLYVGTNIGVCKYNRNTLAIVDCQNQFDGMPTWAVYSVGVDATYVYGGTNVGVGLVTKSTFQHDSNWGEGSQTGNAVVEVMGDVAFIGTEGLGVLRYNISTNEWLAPFDESSGVLDPGNDDVTGLVADIRPNLLWVGGGDGFQLINISTGAEAFDIEQNNNLYGAAGEPFDMMIHNNIMYYHSSTSSDEVSRLDVANLTNLGNLDIGAQVGENGGDIVSMSMVGDVLMVSVVSGQWWNADGSGGIARWNTSSSAYQNNILPTGSIDRVTAYESSNGNTWVAWGELKLDLYDSNQSLVGSWTNFDMPIRGIVEYDGETLFASEDGILRYDESTNQWAPTWTEGNGLPNNAGDEFYELWTDGSDLVVGGARMSNFGGFQEGVISHLSASGAWTAYAADSIQRIPDGYPISMEMCGGLLHIAMYNNNGGVARIDLQNGTVQPSFTSNQLGRGLAASVACDAQQTLYVGYYQDNQPISRYSYASNAFLSSLTTSSHNLPSDRVWYDGLAHSGSQLIVGHGIGFSGSNLIGGGYSTLVANGATALQAQVQGGGSSVTSFQWLGSQWLIGQAGGASGYSHVSTLSSSGMQQVVDLPGLVSGQVSAMLGNSTHVWVATGNSGVSGTGNGGGSGTGILQGSLLPNGTLEWDYGWTLPGNTQSNDLYLDGTDLYMATSPGGMYVLDTVSGAIRAIGGSIHTKFDTMHPYNNQLVVGLAGEDGSPPGVQMFDLNNAQFGNGRLIAGLPSNIINGFTDTSTTLYIATNGGVGRWNYTSNDWMDSITASNGLPSDIVEDVVVIGTTVYMATPAGLFLWDTNTQTGTTMTKNDGLMGISVWGLTTTTSSSGNVTLVLSHDGRGTDRPGATIVDPSVPQVTSTHRFDQLPSNTITSLTSDWWGVHIGSDVGPMTHWNGLTTDFEDGVANGVMVNSPNNMNSNGDDVLIFDNSGATLVEARTAAHAIKWRTSTNMGTSSINDAVVSSTHVWLATSAGLWGWENGGGYPAVEESTMRRALPLTVRTPNNGAGLNITSMVHPGQAIPLVTPSDPYALDSNVGSPGVHNVLFQNVPLIFTSPVDGAALWVKSVALEYSATLNLSGDASIQSNLQSAVDSGQLYNNTRHVKLRLYAPENGSLEVRLTYDYVRSETPVAMVSLVDRPDDGGGTLTASWSLVHDEDFSRYLIFLNEGPWSSTPDELMLLGRTPDKAVSLHSRLSTDITTANGQPLIDGTAYHAAVVVEYNDGRWGKVSAPLGPASPSDEVPGAPAWADGAPVGLNGEDGEVQLEWARCTALDLAATNIYVATTPFSDALGRSPRSVILPNEGNQTVLALTPGAPVWLGLTCVDQAGQENKSNMTVVGPIVPTGELNDNEAPSPIEGTNASDVPDDEGGRIVVSWNQSTASDCAFSIVFAKLGGEADSEPAMGSVDGFSQAVVMNACDQTETVVSSLDGLPLVDGQVYTFGVVAYDLWLNGNTDDVLLVTATPFQNIVGPGTTPPRITSLLAFDHPDDDGTAIDVVWEPSTIDDFASYTVWVASEPVTDLTLAYAAFGTDDTRCGCFSFNKQWIDERTNPIELTLSTALYLEEGQGLNNGEVGLIQPDIDLFVAVTVHDLRGNVYLTNLTQATVTPLDNMNDNTAPERLQTLTLNDRPQDDGSALLLSFDLSSASDVGVYHVYAATWEFSDVTPQGDGPSVPIATLSRNPSLPLVIDIVAGDTPVIPGQDIWVAVVVEDTSGNAHETLLTTATAASVDDGISDPGAYLPDIANVDAQWVGETDVLVDWSHSTDARVRGYQIFIASTDFTNTVDATLVGQSVSSNSFLITAEVFADLDNGTTWYIAVAPYDQTVGKTTVDTVMLNPVNNGPGDSNGTTDGNEQRSLESLLTGPNLMAFGLFLVALLLLVVVVRARGRSRASSKEWSLEEATWGIETPSWEAPPSAPPSAAPAAPAGITASQANDIYAAAQQIQSSGFGREAYQPAQPVLRPQVDPSLLDGLLDEPQQAPKSPTIDTSFLDDLL